MTDHDDRQHIGPSHTKQHMKDQQTMRVPRPQRVPRPVSTSETNRVSSPGTARPQYTADEYRNLLQPPAPQRTRLVDVKPMSPVHLADTLLYQLPPQPTSFVAAKADTAAGASASETSAVYSDLLGKSSNHPLSSSASDQGGCQPTTSTLASAYTDDRSTTVRTNKRKAEVLAGSPLKKLKPGTKTTTEATGCKLWVVGTCTDRRSRATYYRIQGVWALHPLSFAFSRQGFPKGFGHVQFLCAASATSAIAAMKRYLIGATPVAVEYSGHNTKPPKASIAKPERMPTTTPGTLPDRAGDRSKLCGPLPPISNEEKPRGGDGNDTQVAQAASLASTDVGDVEGGRPFDKLKRREGMIAKLWELNKAEKARNADLEAEIRRLRAQVATRRSHRKLP